MNSKRKSRDILEQIIAIYPDAKTILNYSNNFELLIAVMLSAQTTDVAVNKVTGALFQRFPTPADFAGATPAEIEPYIKSIGLYRNKAKHIFTCCNQLMADFNGDVPHTRKELESLAGVGRKTANVVLSVGFGIPAFPVDTHVSRVCKHHGIVPQNATPLEIEKIVTDLLPKKLWNQAHHSIIFFGRNICSPRNPKCDEYLH